MNDHQWTQEHLAWYVNGTLVGEEYARAHQHLSSCVVCQQEHRLQQNLADVIAMPANTSVEPAAALSLFDEAVQNNTQRAPRWLRHTRKALSGTPSPVRMLVAAQAIALVLAIAFLLKPAESITATGAYQTLSQVQSAEGDLHLVFSPQITEHELRRWLLRFNAQIVGGPSQRGVYTISVPAGNVPEIAGKMRQDSAVQFVEAVHPEAD